MKRFPSLLSLVILVGLSFQSVPALCDRAEDLAQKAKQQKPFRCDKPEQSDCHTRFVTGCSHATSPTYDAYLNFLKNQTPDRTLPPQRILVEKDFSVLESNIPAELGLRNHAKVASKLAGQKEGNILAVIGYLYFVEDTSKTSHHRGETTNCQNRGPDTFDYHLGIGFDPKVAAEVASGRLEHDLTGHSPGLLEKTSVVAEMTPHTRDPKWSIRALNNRTGEIVKVVGQLLLDNDHFNDRDDCSRAEAEECWRASVWEIHPITQFFVCKTNHTCDAGSPDSDWEPL